MAAWKAVSSICHLGKGIGDACVRVGLGGQGRAFLHERHHRLLDVPDASSG